MNEKVNLAFKNENEQNDKMNYYQSPSLVIDIDEECSDLTESFSGLKSFEYADPFSIFTVIAKDSHSLEQFTVILMDSLGLIQNDSQKHLDALRNNPVFLVLSSYVEMIAGYFPRDEKVIKTLSIMIHHSEIKKDDKNAVDLMFDDLEEEYGETNRAVYQYNKFCHFPIEEKLITISNLTKAFEKYFPEELSDRFSYVTLMPIIAYLPYCQNNTMQVLKRNCLIYCLKTGLLDRKAILRVNGGFSDIATSLLGEEDYVENEVSIVTPSFKKLIQTINKSKTERKNCRSNMQWKDENNYGKK